MNPLLVFGETYGSKLASWLLAHSSELGDAAARVVRPVMKAITDPTASIDRIGSALVAQQNGQAEVIGLLHRHTTKLDGITTAVDGIGQTAGQIGHSVGALTSLSMIGLGLSALSQVHIAFQFAALTRRIKAIDRRVRAIQEMMVQEQRARLAHGLDDLRRAAEVADTDPTAGRQFTFDARLNLAGSRASYTQQLSDQLSRPSAAEPAYLWMLARHLTTAALGETACHLRLKQPTQSVSVLRAGLAVLRGHATAVFRRTITANPTRFLMPSLAQHGVTLEVIAELYRQARHAGVVEDERAVTEAGVFESLRGQLNEASDPMFGRERKVQRLLAEFNEASAAIEEVTRSPHGVRRGRSDGRRRGRVRGHGECAAPGGGDKDRPPQRKRRAMRTSLSVCDGGGCTVRTGEEIGLGVVAGWVR